MSAFNRVLQISFAKNYLSRFGTAPLQDKAFLSKRQPKQLSQTTRMEYHLPQSIQRFSASGSPLHVSQPSLPQQTLSTNRSLNMVTPKTAKGLLLAETGAVHASDAKAILGAYAAIRSFIVAMYCSQTKTAALTHVDEYSDLQEIVTKLKNMVLKDHPSTRLRVYIAGEKIGQKNQTYDDIKQIIKQDPTLKIASEIRCSGIAIDARTGHVYTEIKLNQLDLGEDFEQRRRHMMAQMLKMLDQHISNIKSF